MSFVNEAEWDGSCRRRATVSQVACCFPEFSGMDMAMFRPVHANSGRRSVAGIGYPSSLVFFWPGLSALLPAAEWGPSWGSMSVHDS